jgi:type II secretory pathway pseudopilin PulG
MLLGQLKRNMLYAERRLNETKEEIQRAVEEEASQNVLDSIQKQIEEYQEEKQDYDSKITCLKLRGAIIYPCIGFGFTLFIYSIKDYLIFNYYLTLISIQFFMSTGLMFGMYRMLLTLRAIEYASTNVPLPDFNVTFTNGEISYSCYSGERNEMDICVHNRGYSVGELLEVAAFLPEGSIIHESGNYSITKQDDDSSYPNLMAVAFDIGTIHVDVYLKLQILFTPPTIPGKYQLPVWVNEKNITQKEFLLELEVLQRPSNLMNVTQTQP